MRLHIKRLRLLAFFISPLFVVAGANAQSIHLPQHEKVVLKNGLTILLLEKRGVPMVDQRCELPSLCVSDCCRRASRFRDSFR